MSFLRKGLLVAGVHMLAVPIGVLVGVILSRSLGPDGMGQYELFRSTALLVGTVLALGVGSANIYFLNNRRISRERITTNSLKAGMAIAVVLTAALSILILAWPGYFGRVAVPTAILFAFGASLGLNTAIIQPILIAQLAAKRIASVELTRALIMLVGACALALTPWLTPDTAILVLAASFSGAFLLVFGYLRTSIRWSEPFDWRLLIDVVVYGVKLAAANVMYLLAASITVFLLRYLDMDNFSQVGLYTRAVAICTLVSMAPRAIGPLLYAKWAATDGERRARQAEMAARMNLAFGVTAWVCVALLGKYLIWALYGQEFLRATDALRFLAPAMLFVPVFGVCNNLLAGDGRAAIAAGILLGTVCIVGIVTLATVPVMGMRGAALAVLCGNAFTAVAGILVCQRLYALRLRDCVVLRVSDVRYIMASLRPRKAGPAQTA